MSNSSAGYIALCFEPEVFAYDSYYDICEPLAVLRLTFVGQSYKMRK